MLCGPVIGGDVLWQADFREEAGQVDARRVKRPGGVVDAEGSGVKFPRLGVDLGITGLPSAADGYRFVWEVKCRRHPDKNPILILTYVSRSGRKIVTIQRPGFAVWSAKSALDADLGGSIKNRDTHVTFGEDAAWNVYSIDVHKTGWMLRMNGKLMGTGPTWLGEPGSFSATGNFACEIRNVRVERLDPPPPLPDVKEPTFALGAYHETSNGVFKVEEALSSTAGGVMFWAKSRGMPMRFLDKNGNHVAEFQVVGGIEFKVVLPVENATNEYSRTFDLSGNRGDDWYHLAFTWGADGRCRMFVNGTVSATGFDTRNKSEVLAFGNRLGETAAVWLYGDKRKTWSRGEVEDLRLYKRAVSNREVLEAYRARMPIDLVFENSVVTAGKSARLAVTAAPGGHYMRPAPVRPWENINAAVDLELVPQRIELICGDKKNPSRVTERTFHTISNGITRVKGVRVDKPVDISLNAVVYAEGEYRLLATVNGWYARTLYFSAGDEADVLSVPASKEKWKPVRTLFSRTFTATNDFDAVEGGNVKIIKAACGAYAEMAEKERGRVGIVMPIAEDALGRPCLLSFDWPDDKPRSMGLYLYREGGSGVRDRLQGGIQAGREIASSGKMQHAEWLVFPSAKHMLFEVRTMVTGWPAAIANVRLEQLAEPLPRLKVHEPEGLKGRGFGNIDEDQTFCNNLNVDRNKGVDGTTFETLRYLSYTGQNRFHYSVARYAWTYGPVEGSLGSGMFPQRQGQLGYIVTQFARNKVDFVGKIALLNIPDIQELRYLDSDLRAKGYVSLDREGLDRARFASGTVQPNPANPGMVNLFFDYFIDEIARYAKGGFAGLWCSAAWGFGSWQDLEIGYDDWTVRRFASEAGEIAGLVPLLAPAKVPDDYLARYRFLISTNTPAVRTAWIDWRARKTTAVFTEYAARLRALNPDMELYIATSASPTAYEKNGIDNSALAKIPGVRLGLSRWPTEARFALTRSDEPPSAEKFAIFDKAVADWNNRDRADMHAIQALGGGSVPMLMSTGTYYETPGEPPRIPGKNFGCSFQDADVKPWGRHFLKEAAYAVGVGDTLEFLQGGQPLGTLGNEDEAREFAQAFRALPAQPFERMNGCDPKTADVIGRSLKTKNGTYFYFVNMTDKPQKTKAPFWRHLDLSTDKIEWGKTIALKPYELRSFRTP